MRGMMLVVLAVLVAGCGPEELGEDVHAVPTQEELQASSTWPAVLRNEGTAPCRATLTYWVKRPASYGTNQGWQPLMNQALAAGGELLAELEAPEGTTVQLHLWTYCGGRYQDLHAERPMGSPSSTLRLAVSPDGTPRLE